MVSNGLLVVDIKAKILLVNLIQKKNSFNSNTNHELIDVIIEEKHTFISTGMHTIEEIKRVVDKFKKNCPFELMHTVSTYPMKMKMQIY